MKRRKGLSELEIDIIMTLYRLEKGIPDDCPLYNPIYWKRKK